MKVHKENIKDNAGTPAAKRISPNHSTPDPLQRKAQNAALVSASLPPLASYQEMADSSARVKQLKMMQEMADKSDRVTQAKVMQQVADTSAMNKSNAMVTQLKLQKGVFNVAGENHDESKKRRDEEQLFAMFAAMSGNYWQESEFKLERENGSSRLGDRAYLRAGHSVQLVFDYHDDYSANLGALIEEIPKKKRTVTFKKLVGTMIKMAERREHFLHEAVAELQREETVEKNNKWVGIKNILDSLTELQLDVDALEEAGSYEDLIGKTDILRQANQKFTQTIQQAFNVYGITKQGEINERLSAKRDVYIHKSASLARNLGIKGVWKIGQDHVDGIKKLGEEIKYNLVTQDEFNQEYEEDNLEHEEQLRENRKYLL
jgi:hypothetical protein